MIVSLAQMRTQTSSLGEPPIAAPPLRALRTTLIRCHSNNRGRSSCCLHLVRQRIQVLVLALNSIGKLAKYIRTFVSEVGE